jgi:hypothetical protein
MMTEFTVLVFFLVYVVGSLIGSLLVRQRVFCSTIAADIASIGVLVSLVVVSTKFGLSLVSLKTGEKINGPVIEAAIIVLFISAVISLVLELKSRRAK